MFFSLNNKNKTKNNTNKKHKSVKTKQTKEQQQETGMHYVTLEYFFHTSWKQQQCSTTTVLADLQHSPALETSNR